MRKRAAAEKPTAIDLFSGCGGLTPRLQQAGFKGLAAVELDAVATKTYELNHSKVLIKTADIRRIPAERLKRELGLSAGDLDLLAGCPPCQGFSALRTRNGSKRNRDARNNLVGEML